MRFNHYLSKALAVTASVSMAALAFSPMAKAASTEVKGQETQNSYQIAQRRACAVVVGARGGLNVRAEPNTDSAIIDRLWNGQEVIVEDEDLEGWVAISGDVEGYVFSDYLEYCY